MASVRNYTMSSAQPGLMLDPSFPYREELLQFIWEQRLFDAKGLMTMEGEPVDVLRSGRLHGHSGPDLVDAEVRIGGQRWVGNIEVHVRSSEWYAHKHEEDMAYDNVVLHVVYEHDMDVRTHAGGRIPTVELKHRIPEARIAAFLDLMHAKAWVPCEHQFHHVDPDRLPLWLDRVLVERLERRCSAIGSLCRALGGDQLETFWHVLATGFGFKVNAEPFGMMARALPLKILLKYRDDPFRTEALLFGQAGLLQVDLLDAYPRDLQQEHRLLAAMQGLKPAPMAAWQFGRLRPPNFPTIRLAQLAQLIRNADGSFASLLEQDAPALLIGHLQVEATGYWLDHHRFDQPSKAAPKRLGADAAAGLIVNAIVPYLFALGKLQGKEIFRTRALRLLEGLPAEKNSVMDDWARLGLRAGSAARSQALIELKDHYCGQRRCLSCVIGASLLKRPTR